MRIFKICLLSFSILFASLDIQFINVTGSFNSKTSATSVCDVIKIQHQLLQQTKTVVSNICNSIAQDVSFLLNSYGTKKVFFNVDKTSIKPYTDAFFNLTKTVFYTVGLQYVSYLIYFKMNLFFFGFIFIYLLRYLGLLFTFGKKTILLQLFKAYDL